MLTADSAESEEMLRMGACSGIVRQCAFISGIVSRIVSVSIYQWHCQGHSVHELGLITCELSVSQNVFVQGRSRDKDLHNRELLTGHI